jgi:hypothetical protein
MYRDWKALLLILAVPLAAVACAARTQPAGVEPAGPNAGRRAALAVVSVQNETTSTLVIAYRAASPQGPEIIVGRVAPDSTVAMSPVPAGEPIILSAAREDGGLLLLAPRTFPMDGEWTWVIEPNAGFRAPAGDGT